MAKKKATSANKKAHYTQYKVENRQEKNRILKLKRHLKSAPNDTLALTALEKINKGGNKYRRRKPENRGINKTAPKYVVVRGATNQIEGIVAIDKEVQSALDSKNPSAAIQSLFYKRLKLGYANNAS